MDSSRKGKGTAARIGWVAAIIAALALGFLIRGRLEHTRASLEGGQNEAREESRTQVWTCAMHPQIRRNEPGLCPICGMELVPDESVETTAGPKGLRVFTTTPEALALMDVRTGPARRRSLAAAVRMVGKIAYDETRVRDITAWVGGRIDRLYVDFTGTEVEKEQALALLYSPALLAAQEELVQAIAARDDLRESRVEVLRETSEKTVASAREKLRLLGLSETQIAEIEKRRKAETHVTIHSPIAGTVVEKQALEGMYVETGTKIYTVADLDSVWVNLEAYESDMPFVREGQSATFTVEALPGETFEGTVSFVDPFLNEMTRTVRVRLDAPNPNGALKPGMFVRASIASTAGPGGDVLVIPASAALVTGTRAVVYVALPGADKPTFEGREIVLGPALDGFYVVRHGLSEGEIVVTSGNFKIDSAVQISAQPSMMSPEGGAAAVHVHGAEAPTPQAGGDETMQHDTGALPSSFTDGLKEIDTAARGCHDAVASGDLKASRAAFAAFSRTLDAVDASSVDGHALLVWRELRMLLGNDAFEGAEARDLEDARRAYRSLEGNAARLRAVFPDVAHTGHQHE